jgi:hypothetical protein
MRDLLHSQLLLKRGTLWLSKLLMLVLLSLVLHAAGFYSCRLGCWHHRQQQQQIVLSPSLLLLLLLLLITVVG